jgi:uncharacterized NAD-dependent epimerase/dehydratase family protein
MATTNKLMTIGSTGTGNLSVSTTSNSVSIAASKSNSEDTIRFVSDVDCHVRITNAASTAVTTDALILGGVIESFGIEEDGIILSAVTASGAGTLNYMIKKGV